MKVSIEMPKDCIPILQVMGNAIYKTETVKETCEEIVFHAISTYLQAVEKYSKEIEKRYLKGEGNEVKYPESACREDGGTGEAADV